MLGFAIARGLALVSGEERAVEFLRKRGHPGLAWELSNYYGLRRMRADPTFTYTFDFAKECTAAAELALEAQAFEWAYLNATDALAVLEWKGVQDGSVFTAAKEAAAQAASRIPLERLEDLAARQEEAKQAHNRVGELRLKQRWRDHDAHVWRNAMRGRNRVRLSDRPK
jgi:hypothetical protein